METSPRHLTARNDPDRKGSATQEDPATRDARRLARNERQRQREAGIPSPMQMLILQNAAGGAASLAALTFGWNHEDRGMSARVLLTRSVRLLQRYGWITLYKGVYSITQAGRDAYLKGTT